MPASVMDYYSATIIVLLHHSLDSVTELSILQNSEGFYPVGKATPDGEIFWSKLIDSKKNNTAAAQSEGTVPSTRIKHHDDVWQTIILCFCHYYQNYVNYVANNF